MVLFQRQRLHACRLRYDSGYGAWFYFDEGYDYGEMYADGMYLINGEWYAFNSGGYMVTGWYADEYVYTDEEGNEVNAVDCTGSTATAPCTTADGCPTAAPGITLIPGPELWLPTHLSTSMVRIISSTPPEKC